MLAWLQLLTIVSSVLIVGVYWGPWLALSRSFAALDPGTFLAVVKRMHRNLERPMTVLTPLAAVPLSGALVLSLGSPLQFGLTLAGGLLLAGTVVVSVVIEVPIVKRMSTWSPATLPAGWEQARDRWVAYHPLRVFPGLAAVALLVAAATFR